MQFAGQRTDMDLNPIGPPDNMYIKITEDILPDPSAVLVTGITPQRTISDGVTESEFTRFFNNKVATMGTIFVGYNNIRFDDEFMRFTLYRNFWDSYEWQWKNGRSRWDLLDATRLTRALRPAGIKWPFDSSGAPSNKLGLLAAANKLSHQSAHDALSDVGATIALAKLIKSKQPKLFDYLLSLRTRQKIAPLVTGHQPFIYTSGKYPSEYEKTTVVMTLFNHPSRQAAIVYDLRFDPMDYAKLSPIQLVEAWRRHDPTEGPVLPVKTLQFNRCPAVAPLSVLENDKASQKRLQIDMNVIKTNAEQLGKIKEWPQRLQVALDIMDKQQQERFALDEQAVDSQLYNGFFGDSDKQGMRLVRESLPQELSGLLTKLKDKRLVALLPLYKARNYPGHLTPAEKQSWLAYCRQRLASGRQDSRMAKYFSEIEELASQPSLTDKQNTMLEELRLYGESVLPGQKDAPKKRQ